MHREHVILPSREAFFERQASPVLPLSKASSKRLQHRYKSLYSLFVHHPNRSYSESVHSAGKHKSDRNDSSTKGKDKTMEQQHESDLVKRLEQLGIEVDVSPTVTTLTYEQIYTSGPTLEEALITFLGEALSRYEALRKLKANTMPIVTDWSDKH